MSSLPPWSASSSTAGSRLCGVSLCREYDNTEREATLYLFTRPVNDSLPDDIMYHHWALVFHFEGNDFRTVEGFGDDDDRLYGSYTKEHPKDEGKYLVVAKTITSPAKVLDHTMANPLNNRTYIATWQNCQTWVKAFAKMLGEEIDSKISNCKTLKEGNPVVAVVGKKSSSFSRSSQSVSNCCTSQTSNSRVS